MKTKLWFIMDYQLIDLEKVFEIVGETMDNWYYPINTKTPLPIGSTIYIESINSNENPFLFTVNEVWYTSNKNECSLLVLLDNTVMTTLIDQKRFVKHLQTDWLRGNDGDGWCNVRTIVKLIHYRWPKIGKMFFRIFKKLS